MESVESKNESVRGGHCTEHFFDTQQSIFIHLFTTQQSIFNGNSGAMHNRGWVRGGEGGAIFKWVF